MLLRSNGAMRAIAIVYSLSRRKFHTFGTFLHGKAPRMKLKESTFRRRDGRHPSWAGTVRHLEVVCVAFRPRADCRGTRLHVCAVSPE
ncbi:hypothetical protein BGLA2_810043 [Burkholderia gladioli]|nr:hypothetical protein BGLA2_810043 [Burkholderia gladioli]